MMSPSCLKFLEMVACCYRSRRHALSEGGFFFFFFLTPLSPASRSWLILWQSPQKVWRWCQHTYDYMLLRSPYITIGWEILGQRTHSLRYLRPSRSWSLWTEVVFLENPGEIKSCRKSEAGWYLWISRYIYHRLIKTKISVSKSRAEKIFLTL